MLKMRCSHPPCTNMDVNSVAHHGNQANGGTSTCRVSSNGRAPSR